MSSNQIEKKGMINHPDKIKTNNNHIIMTSPTTLLSQFTKIQEIGKEVYRSKLIGKKRI